MLGNTVTGLVHVGKNNFQASTYNRCQGSPRVTISMDLENFEDAGDVWSSDLAPTLLSDKEAIDLVDTWYINVNRGARWMDLLGDYAGSELFVIDGASCVSSIRTTSNRTLLSISRRFPSADRS
jgi:hypothetical protein